MGCLSSIMAAASWDRIFSIFCETFAIFWNCSDLQLPLGFFIHLRHCATSGFANAIEVMNSDDAEPLNFEVS